MLLSDAAQLINGKAYMLGAGWDRAPVPFGPHAVAAFVGIPWDRANQQLPLRLRLLQQDGQPVTVVAPDTGEAQELLFEADVEVGRPPGVARGAYLTVPLVQQFGPLPLGPGRYQWRLEVAGEEETVEFELLAPPGA